MPWLYVDATKGIGRAKVTDDDSNEVGILTNYKLNTHQDYPGRWEAEAELLIVVSDIEGWMKGFHSKIMGG